MSVRLSLENRKSTLCPSPVFSATLCLLADNELDGSIHSLLVKALALHKVKSSAKGLFLLVDSSELPAVSLMLEVLTGLMMLNLSTDKLFLLLLALPIEMAELSTVSLRLLLCALLLEMAKLSAVSLFLLGEVLWLLMV